MDEVFEVSLLWYKGIKEFPAHWAIFVSVPGATVGNLYEVKTADTPFKPRWARSYRESYNTLASRTLGGKVFLGNTSDPAEIESISQRERVPDMLTENCQNWVWRVIKKAVEKDVLDSSAIDNLEEAPTHSE
jgi:hypothetical protein